MRHLFTYSKLNAIHRAWALVWKGLIMSIKKQKDGTYSVRVRWTDGQGKRRDKIKTKLANKTLASHWERQTLLDAEAGKFDKVSTYTTANELVEMWLKEYSRNKRDTTVSKVRRFFEMYVLVPEWFNGVQISTISRKYVTCFL